MQRRFCPCLVLGSLTISIALCASVASAQGRFIFDGDAYWSWEASVDNGATWTHGTLEVAQSQQSVLIRSWLAFPPVAPLGYFNGVALDGVVTAVGRTDIHDTASNVFFGVGFTPRIGTTTFGNRLKVDFINDTLPPGEGPDWLGLTQPVLVPGQSRANPINMVNYTLNLDGTTGERLIDGVFRQPPGFPPGRVVYIALSPFNDTDFLIPLLHQESLTIRVVPSPGAAAVFGLLAIRALRRRR